MASREVWLARVRQPASAAVAGIVFALILMAVILLLRNAAPSAGPEAGRWATEQGRRQQVVTALQLIPFAGIAFLWFIGVIRSQVGASEDRFVGTVFLGSGLLFVALMFVAAGALSAALALLDTGSERASEAPQAAGAFADALLGIFGARMGAVFVATVSTVGRRAGALPKWLVASGYVVAVLLLLTPPLPSPSQFLFPVWILLLSGYLLTGRHQTRLQPASSASVPEMPRAARSRAERPAASPARADDESAPPYDPP